MPNLTRDEAEALVGNALLASKVSTKNAASVARALVAAEIDGQVGHGLSRVGSYCAQSASGKVDGHAVPMAQRTASAFLRIDAANGFAFPAMELAIEEVAATALETGIAAAAITRSHHCGQAGAHVEKLAERGCVSMLFANTPKAMAPWGGNAPIFGTNPIAFGTPQAGEAPLVIDLSLSKVARGKVMAASKRGEDIPVGWALDSDGNDTTDAKAALTGSMVPMGDAKGAALALMVELLAAGLGGAKFGNEAASFLSAEGDAPGTGQLLIAFNVSKTAGDGYLARVGDLLGAMLGQHGVRLPGTKRLALREAAEKDGITVAQAVMDEIGSIAAG
jgi:(2R)-3-sulfolactate dehydrogenase (NADP+)